MTPILRKEVLEYMRACERLTGFTHRQAGVMTNDEIEGILSSAEDLERNVLPFCAKHRHHLHSGQ